MKTSSLFDLDTYSVPFRHYSDRPKDQKIDTIILYSCDSPSPRTTYGETSICATACVRWMNFTALAPHYLIDQGGILYQLVDTKKKANHCIGRQMPDGRGDIDDFSIGLGLAASNTSSYHKLQLERLVKVVKMIQSLHPVKEIIMHKNLQEIDNSNSSLESPNPHLLSGPWGFPWHDFEKRIVRLT